jgi:phosphoglycolate phosphatase
VLARLDDHYAETAGTTGLPYADCVDSLRRLRVAGLRLVCLTNKEERFARRVLQQTRLDGYFELLIGGDTLAHKKPHAGVIHHVLRQLGGRAEHYAHIGDSRTDIETARNASVAAWAVPYGYNAGEPIAAAQPDRLFASLADVTRHVLAANAAA